MQAFDYVIVGAGSAGCVLANRLSSDPANSVLLIEAGPRDTNPLIGMPMGIGRVLANKSLNWHLATEPEPGNADRAAIWVRGRLLGGSSSVNGMIYCRGQARDYDEWAEAGLTEWSWAKMAPGFKSMENYSLGGSEIRGVGGPLDITIQEFRSPLSEAILRAAEAEGVPAREDVNEALNPEGLGYTPVTVKGGRRVSAADAFLRPAMSRPNLTIVTDTEISKIHFNGRRAVAVEGIRRGSSVRYRARRTVIVSCGALLSPKLLQLSGVGPADHLRHHGIDVVQNLPGVGQNLREHKTIGIEQQVRFPSYSHNRNLKGLRVYLNALRYFLTRTGVMAATWDLNGFVRTDASLDRPDAQLGFSAVTVDSSKGLAMPHSVPGWRMLGYPLRTRSQGSIMIASADPSAPPVIRPNFLSDPYDGEVIVRIFRIMRRIFANPALQPFLGLEMAPGPDVQTDEQILDASRRGGTCLHAVGTCKMGNDPMSVVDQNLRVHGLSGLRVVDLSIAPTQISGNTNGPVMAMAWRAADLILADPDPVFEGFGNNDLRREGSTGM